MRYDTDSYVVFSPVKDFKSIHLVKKTMLAGFAFNRKYFHASDSVISCVLWSNMDAGDCESWDLEVVDIDANDNAVSIGNIRVKKVYKTLAESIKKIVDAADVETNVCCASDGVPEVYSLTKGRKPVYNENIIGYYVVGGYAVAPINRYLVRCNWKSGISKTMGNHLRKENYKDILPMFCAKMFPQENWYEKDVYFTTSDGGDAYTHDPQFLKSCLIYTCLSNQNKCLSFDGSDGRRYQNELCFDNSKTYFAGFDDDGNPQPVPQSAVDALPLALKDLNKYVMSKATALDDDEKKLMEVWNQIITEARNTAGYNPAFNYGVYQITKELNTFQKISVGKSEETVYDYPVLNGHLITLRTMLKAYYKSHITDKMFKYGLLK